MKYDKLIVRCDGCGEERTVPAIDAYTGMAYGAEWVWTCATCGSELVNIRPAPEPGKHELECEKTLAEYIYKQSISWKEH